MVQLARRHETIWNDLGIAEGLRYLITEQERATPRTVNGQISIIKLDKKGIHWIDHGECQQN